MVLRTALGGRRRGGFRWQIMLLFAIGAAVYYFMNQKDIPYICDNEFSSYGHDMCRQQLRTMKLGQEIELGKQSYLQILQDEHSRRNLVTNPNDYQLQAVRQIGDRIRQAARDADPGFQWEFNLIRSDQANAFALPGGYTAVYTGMIEVAENDPDMLAVVMGHEVAHALAHHGAERMAQQNMQRIVGAGVSMGAGGMDMESQRAVMGVFGGLSQYGFALPFSRKHETEADYIGLILMARACFDPRKAPKLWENMNNMGGAKPPEFQSTHPSPETRMQNFNDWMPMAVDIYNENNCTPRITSY